MAIKRSLTAKQTELLTDSKLELSYISLNDLTQKFLTGNSKKHDIEKMKRSYQEYGFRDPVAIDKNLNNGKGGIVEGNGRVEALQSLFENNAQPPKNIEVKDEIWYVPVIFGGDSESEQDAIAFSIEHNLSVLWGSEFSTNEILKLFDADAISEQLKGLMEAEINPITFENQDLSEMISQLQDSISDSEENGHFDEENQDEIPEESEVETRVKTGDIWQLGEHFLLCGDCTVESNVKELLKEVGDRNSKSDYQGRSRRLV